MPSHAKQTFFSAFFFYPTDPAKMQGAIVFLGLYSYIWSRMPDGLQPSCDGFIGCPDENLHFLREKNSSFAEQICGIFCFKL
ncbi:hypothetical protein [Parabacteroides sp. PF5-6]|uniref:hypothetical protein n=1 Tax=Parabacteroides sp. PF5-6 TaxID=1742403 RepID=UPI002406F307|nr:hypothetical protein [Parabacteroides sp. PF5-6]MDF9831768.1 hypothetical protein [Parabacteroides sp. PF5-6]